MSFYPHLLLSVCLVIVAGCRSAQQTKVASVTTTSILNAPYDKSDTVPKSKRLTFTERRGENAGSGSWIAKNKFLTAAHVIAPLISQKGLAITIGSGPSGTDNPLQFSADEYITDLPDRFKPFLLELDSGKQEFFPDEKFELVSSDMGVLIFDHDVVSEADIVKLSLKAPEVGDVALLAGYGVSVTKEVTPYWVNTVTIGTDSKGRNINVDYYAQFGKRHVGTAKIAAIASPENGQALEVVEEFVRTTFTKDSGMALSEKGDSGSLIFDVKTGEAIGLVSTGGREGAVRSAHFTNFTGTHVDCRNWLQVHLPYFEIAQSPAERSTLEAAATRPSDSAEVSDRSIAEAESKISVESRRGGVGGIR